MALFALNQRGVVPTADPAYRRGVAFLVETRKGDGTWFVKKRTVALNTYYDAGYPYGKDQFISMPASCWATMALALVVEPTGVNGTAKGAGGDVDHRDRGTNH